MVEIRNTRTTHLSSGSTCLAAYIDWMSSGQIAASTIIVISIRKVGPNSRSTRGSRAMVGMVRQKSMTHWVLFEARREVPMSRPTGTPITAHSDNPAAQLRRVAPIAAQYVLVPTSPMKACSTSTGVGRRPSVVELLAICHNDRTTAMAMSLPISPLILVDVFLANG